MNRRVTTGLMKSMKTFEKRFGKLRHDKPNLHGETKSDSSCLGS